MRRPGRARQISVAFHRGPVPGQGRLVQGVRLRFESVLFMRHTANRKRSRWQRRARRRVARATPKQCRCITTHMQEQVVCVSKRESAKETERVESSRAKPLT